MSSQGTQLGHAKLEDCFIPTQGVNGCVGGQYEFRPQTLEDGVGYLRGEGPRVQVSCRFWLEDAVSSFSPQSKGKELSSGARDAWEGKEQEQAEGCSLGAYSGKRVRLKPARGAGVMTNLWSRDGTGKSWGQWL